MKAEDIEVGSVYVAKISNKLVKVRVDGVGERVGYKGKDYLGRVKSCSRTVYHVTNLSTGRTATFKSAAKFRGRAGS